MGYKLTLSTHNAEDRVKIGMISLDLTSVAIEGMGRLKKFLQWKGNHC